jgi:hypothetical protein
VPIDYREYPTDWSAIRKAILGRAMFRCECMGECGLHRTHPGPRRCNERQGERAKWAKGNVVLTIAHLDRNPDNSDPANLRAMCQRCHLRYDSVQHRQNSAKTRRRKRENLEMELTGGGG